MIVGSVQAHQAGVVVTLRDRLGHERVVQALIDTGSVFPLTLPPDLFEEFGRGYLHEQTIVLANDSEQTVPALDAEVVEFRPTVCTAILLPGVPLIGMPLLENHRLTIDVTEGGRVTVEPLP